MAKWTPQEYTPFFLKDEPTHSMREIRAEYTRMRAIVRKRAVRLREAGFETRADFIMNQIPSLKTLDTQGMSVEDHLMQAHHLWESDSFSIGGMKRIQDEIEKATGFKIPLSDILEFDDYMKSWRLSKYRYTIDTNTVVRLYYNEYQEVGGTFENFYDVFLARHKGK